MLVIFKLDWKYDTEDEEEPYFKQDNAHYIGPPLSWHGSMSSIHADEKKEKKTLHFSMSWVWQPIVWVLHGTW